MQTPDTDEGALTELIMAEVRTRLPDLPTHQYNQMWSAVLHTLNERLPTLKRLAQINAPEPKGLSRREYLNSEFLRRGIGFV